MARTLIQLRREAERTRVEAFEASLRRVSQRVRPAPNFDRAIDEAKLGFEAEILRDAWAWRPQLKTRDPGRLRLAAARYLFARYPVADHLEQIWIDCSGLDRGEIMLRKRWFIVAAGGGSLYREAGGWLSRREVHAFLHPLASLRFDEAIWQAIARSYSNDPLIALRIARSRIAQTPRGEVGFWREVARYFCVHPVAVEELNDFGDYFADCYLRNPQFSLKGRTVASLGRLMHEWHHDLAAIARMEAARRRAEAARARARGAAVAADASVGDSWPGAAVANWSWSPATKDRSKREEYLVIQLRTAADLVAETRAMRHCIASYAAKCISGHASIWSLRCRAAGNIERLLTIELDCHRRAIQVRGFANRPAGMEERKLLERWAKARGIDLQ